MTIPGASQFLGAATLANTRGLAAQAPSLLGDQTISLLDSGRRIGRDNGIGLSSEARARNRARFDALSGNANALFSFTVGESSTIEAAQTQIQALRASTPNSQLARSLQQDDGGFSAPETGQTVDTEA